MTTSEFLSGFLMSRPHANATAKPELIEKVWASVKANRDRAGSAKIRQGMGPSEKGKASAMTGPIFPPLPSPVRAPLATLEEQRKFMKLLELNDELSGPCA
jgi:hypothetical protein